jgi:hypothetical protein
MSKSDEKNWAKKSGSPLREVWQPFPNATGADPDHPPQNCPDPRSAPKEHVVIQIVLVNGCE